MSEALKLADKLSSYSLRSGYAWWCHKAAAELRRLHADSEIMSRAYGLAIVECHAKAAEIERLRSCLKQANSNHENFEREWYLCGDDLDKANTLLRQALEALAKYTTLGVLGDRVPIDAELVAAIKQHLGEV